MIPGVDGPCTREHPCPKILDLTGISWTEGCWAYRNQTQCDWGPMKVWVVVSDCGLNGPVIHGVYTQRPSDLAIKQFVAEERFTEDGFRIQYAGSTGYQFTETIEMELNGDLR